MKEFNEKYQRPVDDYVKQTSEFGMRTHPISGKKIPHGGLDFGVQKGSPVYAAADGEVIRVIGRQNEAGQWEEPNSGFGRVVVIEHSNGEATLYAHLSDPQARVGDRVMAGSVIGFSGDTGASAGQHLHFEIISADYVKAIREGTGSSLNIDKFSDAPDSRINPGVLSPHTKENDEDYTPPLGVLDPLNDAQDSGLFKSAGNHMGNLMSGVTDFFSHAFDRITGNTPRQQARRLMAGDDFYRQMGLNPTSLEKLLENGMESLMGKITEHLTRSGNVGSLALGRTLAQHPTMLADIMRASRRNELGGAFEDVLFGKNGNSGLVGDAITNAVMSGINRTLGVGKMRTRTSSAESERSRETARNWNYSRGQQQAMVAAWVARGQRNL